MPPPIAQSYTPLARLDVTACPSWVGCQSFAFCSGFKPRVAVNFDLQVPCSNFDSLGLDVLLKIVDGELESPRDPVVCESILFGEPVDVSSRGLKVLGGLIDVEKPLCSCNGHCLSAFLDWVLLAERLMLAGR